MNFNRHQQNLFGWPEKSAGGLAVQQRDSLRKSGI
jgi:hypothetical protein